MAKEDSFISKKTPRKVFRITKILSVEFDELVVRPTGLSDAEVIRGLILQAIREQKRYLVIRNGSNGTH